MKVLKFWWTSLWSLEMIQKTAKIIAERKKTWEELVIVVSAMTWVTNNLIKVCELIESKDTENTLKEIKTIKEKHIEVAKNLWETEKSKAFIHELNKNLEILHDIVKWVALLWDLTQKDKAKILYFWEILSSILLSLALNKLWVKSNFYKSANIIMCNWNYMNAEFEPYLSTKKANDFLLSNDLSDETPVITWFWWWDENWDIYLFDRWWSDYVWTILWNVFNAESVEIWTDVDGDMSADPRIIKNAIIWEELDFLVSAELALTWAKVLHPKTISPAQEKNIPVYIKNTFNPSAKWTKICESNKQVWIKWINIDNKQVLITFIDNDMLSGVWYLYSAIKILSNNSIIIDAVATSETSFTLSIKETDLSKEILNELFSLSNKFKISIDKDVTKISIIWDTINNYSILSELEDIKLVSKWGFNKSLTIFIKKMDKDELLKKLHKSIFWI